MALNWIDVNDYDFNCILLLERFQLRYLCECAEDIRGEMGVALRAHSAVKWYIAALLPEHAKRLDEMTRQAGDVSPEELRRCECAVLGWMEDFVTYTTPEVMATHCPFVYGWDKARLYEIADLTGKRVLDVGSGNGRLTFAAAEKAAEVFAVEPVGTLRHFLQESCKARGIRNVRVTEGFAEDLPYPDSTFDVVLSGHVVGDDYDAEIAEMTRVCKPGGLILDVPGDQRNPAAIKQEMVSRGFEALPYTGSFGAQVVRYRKVVKK
ncbi:MAG: class I SAM-dependent methyltransferase [Clostridiales bacterium]|nr:class I SAM-dependent methyltransferase [Clostridiales bacterium]